MRGCSCPASRINLTHIQHRAQITKHHHVASSELSSAPKPAACPRDPDWSHIASHGPDRQPPGAAIRDAYDRPAVSSSHPSGHQGRRHGCRPSVGSSAPGSSAACKVLNLFKNKADMFCLATRSLTRPSNSRSTWQPSIGTIRPVTQLPSQGRQPRFSQRPLLISTRRYGCMSCAAF